MRSVICERRTADRLRRSISASSRRAAKFCVGGCRRRVAAGQAPECPRSVQPKRGSGPRVSPVRRAGYHVSNSKGQRLLVDFGPSVSQPKATAELCDLPHFNAGVSRDSTAPVASRSHGADVPSGRILGGFNRVCRGRSCIAGVAGGLPNPWQKPLWRATERRAQNKAGTSHEYEKSNPRPNRGMAFVKFV